MTDIYDSNEWVKWIASIRANPLDYLRNLACSGWLEDNGDRSRADWVRLQCRFGDYQSRRSRR